LPAAVEIRSGDVVTAHDLGTLGGQVVHPLAGAGFEVQITFSEPSPSGTVPKVKSRRSTGGELPSG
jgi:hypothetical protein